MAALPRGMAGFRVTFLCIRPGELDSQPDGCLGLILVPKCRYGSRRT
jgi:hypothetical protein